MSGAANFDAIKGFFSGYFHEDWPEEADSAAEVVALYLADGPAMEDRLLLAEQIERFIASHPDDEELDKALLEDLGCYYLPAADDISARDWLRSVAATLRSEAEDAV
jgi:hypothetical protein